VTRMNVRMSTQRVSNAELTIRRFLCLREPPHLLVGHPSDVAAEIERAKVWVPFRVVLRCRGAEIFHILEFDVVPAW
jgi:hypothetical protein